jgi:hypothetical protein
MTTVVPAARCSQKVENALRSDGIEPRCGLVVQHDLGCGHGRARHADALLLPATEACRQSLFEAAQPHARQPFADALADLRVGGAALAQRKADIFGHGHEVEQRIVLEQHAHALSERR